MSLSTAEKGTFGGGLIVGVLLAILFGVLAGNDENNRTAYIGAAVTCGVIAVVCLIYILVKKD